MKAKLPTIHWSLTLSIILILGLVSIPSNKAKASGPVLPESNDFASRVLHDPWDMNDYSDISQHINGDGQFNQLQNISVSNGIFSAKSTDDRFNASVFILFPGFANTISAGKVGDLYPIESTRYKCFYSAMKVDSVSGQNPADVFALYWFATKNRNNDPASLWGGKFFPLKENPASPNQYWNLYKVDLSQITSTTDGNALWASQPKWIGLRLDPTKQPNVVFQIDWVRLTDCNPVNLQVNWGSISGNTTLWARPVGTTRNIRIAVNLPGTGATIDLQGLPPGQYDLYRSSSTETCCSALVMSFEINDGPIVGVTRPSYTSGAAYNLNKHSWEMSNSSDINLIECVSNYKFTDGKLVIDTPSGEFQGGSCKGGGVSDPRINLASPNQISTHQYRYLTYKIYTEGSMQKFGKGWLVRWIWESNGCTMVSRDIPYDTGWHTYSIDLADPYAGLSVQQIGSCPGGTLSWLSPASANKFRLDPNENITGTTLHQEIDWISLNAMDTVPRGMAFPITFTSNKTGSSTQYTAYYTTNRANPTQSIAQLLSQTNPPGQSRGPITLFLPIVDNGIDPGSIVLLWNTGNVNPGQYYVCIKANDGLNETIGCSDAPVAVQ